MDLVTIAASISAASVGIVSSFVFDRLKSFLKKRQSQRIAVKFASGKEIQIDGRITDKEEVERAIKSIVYSLDDELLFNPTKADLHTDIVIPVIRALSNHAEQNDLEIQVEKIELSRTLNVDVKALQQVIFNILDNAIKYSKRGTRVRVIYEDTGESIVIDISNFGIPISSDEAERIFQAGYRGAEAQEPHSKGSGLGLYVAKKLMKGMGGKIELIPTGEQTDVKIKIPKSLEAS